MGTPFPSSGPGIGGQALLKRRAGSSPDEFREHYINRHGPIAILWCLANGVSYYAQIHRPFRWSTPELETKYKLLGVDLEDWDAVAEMVFPPIVTLDDYYRAKTGKAYHLAVILPDEKRFLLDEALKILQSVEPSAVTGDRVELIVDGEAIIDVGKWQKVSNKYDAESTERGRN